MFKCKSGVNHPYISFFLKNTYIPDHFNCSNLTQKNEFTLKIVISGSFVPLNFLDDPHYFTYSFNFSHFKGKSESDFYT